MQQVLIIPGFLQGPFSPLMRRTKKLFERNGFKVKVARIHWVGRTMTEWLEQMEDILKDFNMRDTIIVGFSHGAMIATMVAARQTPQHLVLCSLSDSWAEDERVRNPSILKLILRGRQLQDFKAYTFSGIAPMIAAPTTIFIGEKEAAHSPRLLARSKAAHNLIKNSRLMVVPLAGHNVVHPNYQAALTSLASTIS